MGQALTLSFRGILCIQGWKLAPACWPLAGNFYVGPVKVLSGQVKFSITSMKILGIGSSLWNMGVVGPVDENVSFHASVYVGNIAWSYIVAFQSLVHMSDNCSSSMYTDGV